MCQNLSLTATGEGSPKAYERKTSSLPGSPVLDSGDTWPNALPAAMTQLGDKGALRLITAGTSCKMP